MMMPCVKFVSMGAWQRCAGTMKSCPPHHSKTVPSYGVNTRARKRVGMAAMLDGSLITTVAGPDGWGPQGLEAIVLRISSCSGLPPAKVREVLESNSELLPYSEADGILSTMQGLAESLGVTPEKALLMLSMRPSLLHMPVEDVQAQCQQAAFALSLGPAEAIGVICRQPGMLDVPIRALATNIRRIASLLNVDGATVATMLSRADAGDLEKLLLMPSNIMQQHLIDIQAVLDSRLSTSRSPHAAELVLRNPTLLLASTVGMADSLDKAIDIIQVPRKRMAKLLIKCPELLTLAPLHLTSQFRGMVSALHVAPSVVVAMLGREPRLIMMTPRLLQSRMAGLQHMLFIPRQQAVSMALRQPQLLQYSSVTLQRHLVELRDTLRVSMDAVLLLVARHPNLLCFSPASLQAKVEHLATLLPLPQTRAIEMVLRKPVLLTQRQERIADNYRGLQAVLQVPAGRRLADAVQQCPGLLLQAPAHMAELVADAAMLLAAPESHVVDMALRRPGFLLDADPRLWQTNLDTLTSQLGLSVSTARSLVRLFPALLSIGAQWLYQRCTQLHYVLSLHPSWEDALDTSPPVLIRKCLYYGSRELEHLQYLAAAGLQATCGPCHPILHDRVSFKAEYPEFEKWRARKRAQEAREGRMREWSWVEPEARRGDVEGTGCRENAVGLSTSGRTWSSRIRNEGASVLVQPVDPGIDLQVDAAGAAAVDWQGLGQFNLEHGPLSSDGSQQGELPRESCSYGSTEECPNRGSTQAAFSGEGQGEGEKAIDPALDRKGPSSGVG